MLNDIPGLRIQLLLLLALGCVWFSTLGYRHLVHPDEGRYAEIAREMAVSGDWITPRLNAIKYFEKPPLQYWMTAAAFKLFGYHEWSARLWVGLTAFLGVLLAWFAGRRLFNEAAGFYAAMFLGSSLYYVLLGQINTLDMGVTLFLTAALAGFLIAQQAVPGTRRERNWMLAAWASMALATLSKGLIGIVIPGGVLIVHALLERDLSVWKRLYIIPGIGVFLLIAAPWFVLVSVANPEFPWFFFVHEHLLRFTTHTHRRGEPIWFFVPILLIGLVPWMAHAFYALTQAFQAKRSQPSSFACERFLAVWCVFVFLFFSASGSKLPAYILPLFPALALLAGRTLAYPRPTLLLLDIVVTAIFAVLVLAAIPFALKAGSHHEARELYADYAPWLIAAAAVLAAGCAYAFFEYRRLRLRAGLFGLAVSALFATLLGLAGYETLSPSNSAYLVAARIKSFLGPTTPVYSVRTYDQTLPFYLGRSLTLVDYWDEFEYGLKREPHKAIPTLEQFQALWRSGKPAIAMMKPQLYDEFARHNLSLRLIARDSRRAIIATP